LTVAFNFAVVTRGRRRGRAEAAAADLVVCAGIAAASAVVRVGVDIDAFAAAEDLVFGTLCRYFAAFSLRAIGAHRTGRGTLAAVIITGVGIDAFSAATRLAVGTLHGWVAVTGAVDADKSIVAGVVTTSAVVRIGVRIDTLAVAKLLIVGTAGLRDIEGAVVVFAKAVDALQVGRAITIVGAAIGGLGLKIAAGDCHRQYEGHQ